MSAPPAPDTPAAGGLRGALWTWLQTWSDEPRPSSPTIATQAAAAAGQASGSARVLVVDDNPVNLLLMSAMLESRGLVPAQAADGAQAVALAREERFDLILMDLQMPVLDGLDATSAIRRFEGASQRPAVPVIAYSSALPDAAVLARHGLSGSLGKPCEDQHLELCLLRWCPSYRPATTGSAAAASSSPWQAVSAQADRAGAAPR